MAESYKSKYCSKNKGIADLALVYPGKQGTKILYYRCN